MRAGILNPHGNATYSHLPRFSIPTALDHHLLLGIAELTGNQPLRILEVDTKVIHDKRIQMGTPVQDLFSPCFDIANLAGKLCKDTHHLGAIYIC